MSPARAWNRFWFAPTSARPLGALRVLFGLTWLASLALLAPDADHWLSGAGLLRGAEARELAGPWRPSPLQWAQGPGAVHAFLAGSAIIGVLFTLGWHTRAMSALLYAATLSIHHRNLTSASGADVYLNILSFLLMLSPCGAAYSLDARRAARRLGVPCEPLIQPWAVRLIGLQVSMIYLATAALKLAGSAWRDGSALHYVLSNGEVRRFALGLDRAPTFSAALTWGAVATELGLVVLPWVRRARPWVLLAGLILHISIMLTINIPIFGELMVLSYLAFLTPSEFDALVRLVNPRRWRGRREETIEVAASGAPPAPQRRRRRRTREPVGV